MLNRTKVYNPQISLVSYLILKRLSWLSGKPMTKTLDSIISSALESNKTHNICAACKAKKSECAICPVLPY